MSGENVTREGATNKINDSQSRNKGDCQFEKKKRGKGIRKSRTESKRGGGKSPRPKKYRLNMSEIMADERKKEIPLKKIIKSSSMRVR